MDERDIVRQKAVDAFIISERSEFMVQIHVFPLLVVSRRGTIIIVRERDINSSTIAMDTRKYILHLAQWNVDAFNIRLRLMNFSIQSDGLIWGLGANWGQMFHRCHIRHGAVLSLWVLLEENHELTFLFRLYGYVAWNGILPSLRTLQQAACDQGVAGRRGDDEEEKKLKKEERCVHGERTRVSFPQFSCQRLCDQVCPKFRYCSESQIYENKLGH